MKRQLENDLAIALAPYVKETDISSIKLIGCRAIVEQGDTLCEPYRKGYPRERMMRTPAMQGALI